MKNAITKHRFYFYVAIGDAAKGGQKVALGLIYFGTIQYRVKSVTSFLTQRGQYGAWGISVGRILANHLDHGLMFAHGQVSSVKNIPP